MAIGALHGGACFGSQAAAIDAFYGASAPVLSSGSVSYLSVYEKVGGSWQVQKYSDSGGQLSLVSSVLAPVVSFPECDTFETFKDGQMLGWGVVAAMVAAWCVVNMRRGL